MRLKTIATLAVSALALFAQSETTPREFEAASLKPAKLSPFTGNSGMYIGCLGGPGSKDPQRLTCTKQTLRTMLERAYHLRSAQIHGPSWLDEDIFDVAATIGSGATKEDTDQMLQRLLTARFQMSVRRSTRVQPIYALTAVNGDAKLPRSQPDDDDAAKSREMGHNAGRKAAAMRGHRIVAIMQAHMSMPELAESLSARLDRPVVDSTGITGAYRIELVFALDGPDAGPDGATGPEPTTPSQALAELGLRLEKTNAPVEDLFIDKITRTPVQN